MSYNQYLYKKRIELELSRKQFAKLLGINRLAYFYFEKGYFLPSKKTEQKINSYFEGDFSPHLQGEESYPVKVATNNQKADKKTLFAKLFSNTNFLTGFVVFIVLLGALLGLGFIMQKGADAVGRSRAGTTLNTLTNYINVEGQYNVNIIKEFSQKEIYENSPDEYVSIRKPASSTNPADLNMYYLARIKDETYSDIRVVLFLKANYNYDMTLTIMNTGEDIKASFQRTAQDNFKLLSASFDTFYDQELTQALKDRETLETFVEIIMYGYMLESDASFSRLIKNSIGVDTNFYSDIYQPYQKALGETTSLRRAGFGIIISSFIAIVVSLSLAIYYFLTREKTIKITNQTSLRTKEYKQLPNNIRFSAFLPEVVVAVIGVILVFIGSTRFLVNALGGTGLIKSLKPLVANGSFATLTGNLFYIGIFLMFFIDFDTEADLKKIVKNIVMYAATFLIIYVLEASVISSMLNSGSILTDTLIKYIPSNPFLIVSCYFIIMLSLFYTPLRCKNNKILKILWRTMSLLPTTFIFISFFYSQLNIDYSNVWFNYFIQNSKFSFSLLAVVYLYIVYFVKMFYFKKYGPKNSDVFFTGNKFKLEKNFCGVIAICLVVIVEFILSKQPYGSPFRIAFSPLILILLPIMLFYQPQIGSRNKVFNGVIYTIYYISLYISYIVIIGVYIGLQIWMT